jgi:hypothetical protein
LEQHFTEKVDASQDHDEFNKQVSQLHLVVNRGVELLRKQAGLPHWTDKVDGVPKLPTDPEEIERGLQEVVAELKLALTGEKDE